MTNPPSDPTCVTSRTFSAEDQIAFADLSGDYNPLHVDPVTARRLLFGSVVVHGIHLLLWGLDSILVDVDGTIRIRSLKLKLRRPVKIGEEARLFRGDDEGSFTIVSSGGGLISVTAAFEPHDLLQPDCLASAAAEKWPREPRVPSTDEIERLAGTLDLALSHDLAARLFPRLSRRLCPAQTALVLSTTRLVGMTCPGLHSLYAELDLTTPLARGSAAAWKVVDLDRRFGLVQIDVESAELTGCVRAFLRPAPTLQPDFVTLKALVADEEFAGQRALIIGGSRGLGEVAAKLLCAGGARSRLTYKLGREEARRVVDDIVSAGGRCDLAEFDVLDAQLDLGRSIVEEFSPTDLYYFASPFAFAGTPRRFSPELFRSFCDYYVAAFSRIVEKMIAAGVKRIFFPSTIAVDSPPPNMGEYAAAKVAGEMTCTFLQSIHKGVVIHMPRFPRLSTDQTASIVPIENADAAPVVLRELRVFRDLT